MPVGRLRANGDYHERARCEESHGETTEKTQSEMVNRPAVTHWRDQAGQIGVWVPGVAIDDDPSGSAAGFAAFVEGLGYGALWIGGGNPDPAAFARIEALLSATHRLVVATGITSIWAWEPATLAARAKALEAAYPGRFLLGLGVSHAPVVEQMGRRYERPFDAMVNYLDALDARDPLGATGGSEHAPTRVLAALGPRMLRLSAGRASGAHPYLTTAEHTRFARRTLGASPLLAPEQAIVLDDDQGAARRRARAYLERYLRLPNYTANLRRIGWGSEHLEGGGSDALVDALVVHGSPEDVRAAVLAHLDAGADHVCIQALGEGGGVDRGALEMLAPTRGALAPGALAPEQSHGR
jgi:probable F420-dependent oxidoreductase